MGSLRSKIPLLLTVGAVLLVLAGAVCWTLCLYDPAQGLKAAISELVRIVRSEDTAPIPFILMMAVLPMVGFPISLFLVAAGLKFGLLGGLAVSAATMPLHLLVAYPLAVRLLRGPIRRLARRIGYPIPVVPENRAAVFTFVFFAIPGIPYTFKNLLLPLGGVPFRLYFFIGWAVQWAMGIPFMGLGDSVARMNPYVLGAFVALLVVGYGVIRWFRTRYGHLVK